MEDSNSFERLKSLDLNHDEINRLGEALKKDEFRQLLIDYVKEIQDPENKKLYEDEITQLEKERGNDITFLHPTPCYVIKTSVNGNKKCFINICGNDHVNKPSSTPSEKDGSRGLQWSLPHSMSPPAEDLDNKGERCQVFDVLFHPDTLHLAQKNKAFRIMVNNTACNAIENHFDVKLDQNNLKFPKMKYKGIARASIIRKPSAEGPIERSPEEKEFYDKIYAHADESKQNFKNVIKNKKTNKKDLNNENSIYTTPKYIIKHRKIVEFEEFTEHKESKLLSALPKELIVEVNLPLLKSANEIILDVTEKTVQLISEKPAKYKLIVSLPYHVNQDDGRAKFDKDHKKLVITLPVRRNRNTLSFRDFTREDSGVDSDHGSPVSLESEEEALVEHSACDIAGTESELEVISEPQFRTKFLDENVDYSIPEFTCHVFDNIIAFTLNVKNVDSESVNKLIDKNRKTVHIKFISISPSFYQLYYAFYVKLPVTSIDDNLVTVEVWDNNVILQIPFANCDNELVSFMYGLCEENMHRKYLEEPHIINAVHEKSEVPNLFNDGELANDEKLIEATSKCESEVETPINIQNNFRSQNSTEDEESQDLSATSKSIEIQTSYESSGDELSCSFSPSKGKGILKRNSFARNAFSRSISESSIDDCIGSLDYEGGIAIPEDYEGGIAIPEDNEAGSELSTSLKKTVRFNDVVSKQLYRFNSSILGQKKKNQRKSQKKKKAQERRHSESEASEIEEKKEDHIMLKEEIIGVKNVTKAEENIFDLDM